jgi:hypothetical protein
MSKHWRHLIANQSRAKVAEKSHDNKSDHIWFAALAAFSAGVFYLFAYYFGGTIWHALAGG